MKNEPPTFAQRYQEELRKHLGNGQFVTPASATVLACEANSAGIRTQEVARLHERIMVGKILQECPVNQRPTIIKRAGIFFAAATAPAETKGLGRRDSLRLQNLISTMCQHSVELAAANRELSTDNNRRRATERTLKARQRTRSKSLQQSDLLKGQLRRLSREVLLDQEDERKKISRELHDVIAQALTGINVRLANLKREAALNTKELARNISMTQRLVAKSVHMVHQFARELRPAALDDLGLIPALHSYLKHFMERTGVRTRLTAFAGLEQLDTVRRTVLYRVAQEALTNVARHARASNVRVAFQKNEHSLWMQVQDDGISFQVQPVLLARGTKRLGLLGMRERVEMVGGRLDIESAPGKGTTITAHLPLGNGKSARTKLQTP